MTITDMLKNVPLLLLLGGALVSCGVESNTVVATSPETSAVTPVNRRLDGAAAAAMLTQNPQVQVLDVRTAQEFQSGHLSQAQHLDFYDPTFGQRLQTLDTAQTYLVYCAVGGRSRDAVRQMETLGFRHVYDATDGFDALQRAGLPTQ